MSMLLEVEKRQPIHPASFAVVEKALRGLKSYGPQSFAILTKQDGSYLQVAGGRVTCVLEMHEMPQGTHWRAYLERPKVPFEGTQTMMFGAGRITMEPSEILFVDDVVDVFRAFFEGSPLPAFIKWRDMSSIVQR